MADKLLQERQVQLSRYQVQRILKKTYRWKRTRASHQHLQDPVERELKRADWETLKQAAADGHIKLKYMDEAGCSCWSPVSYSWSRCGVQKRQEQTKRRGQRVNIIGIWEPQQRLVYGLVIGKMTSARYIRLMDWQAQQAARLFKRSGKITVIGQDNAPIHTSAAVRNRIRCWQEQGLYLFHFPKYCSELNEIEIEWQRIKEDEIRGQMFEHEHDLSMEIVRAMKARGERAGYQAQRFGFKSRRIVE